MIKNFKSQSVQFRQIKMRLKNWFQSIFEEFLQSGGQGVEDIVDRQNSI